MKKFLCLLLTLALCLAFCACDKQKENNISSGGSGEIDRYAKEGSVPELSISLGSSPDDVKKHYTEAENEHDPEAVLREVEGNLAVCLMTPNVSYYYEKANKENGISVIAVMGGTAYGFSLDSTTPKSAVTAELSADYTESAATEDEQYFLPVTQENCEKLSALFDNYRIDFFFVSDALIAVTLTDTANWTD